ncbi:hypothetical protein C2E23DRAFT_172255 [Lenzites betulinus]|nr:hypothetical protein C2E23DRAFT_172255 [Lenzites betulinus]
MSSQARIGSSMRSYLPRARVPDRRREALHKQDPGCASSVAQQLKRSPRTHRRSSLAASRLAAPPATLILQFVLGSPKLILSGPGSDRVWLHAQKICSGASSITCCILTYGDDYCAAADVCCFGAAGFCSHTARSARKAVMIHHVTEYTPSKTTGIHTRSTIRRSNSSSYFVLCTGARPVVLACLSIFSWGPFDSTIYLLGCSCLQSPQCDAISIRHSAPLYILPGF